MCVIVGTAAATVAGTGTMVATTAAIHVPRVNALRILPMGVTTGLDAPADR